MLRACNLRTELLTGGAGSARSFTHRDTRKTKRHGLIRAVGYC